MSTMNISLPDELRTFVDERVREGLYSSSSEYVRQLIREDRAKRDLRALLLDGATSDPGGEADGAFFEALRSRVRS